MRMQKPSQGGDLWISSAKNSHREKGFETHPSRMPLIVMLVCMFQKSSPCRGFFKTLLPVEGFWVLSWYVCLCWYVCFKSPLPVEDFSKPFSLWRVSDYWASMYVCVMSLTHKWILDIWTIHRTPPHKSWKIELNVKYWTVSVRNRTHASQREFSLLEPSEAFWRHLEASKAFWSVLKLSGAFCRLLEAFGGVMSWPVVTGRVMSWYVMIVMTGHIVAWPVMTGQVMSWPVMTCQLFSSLGKSLPHKSHFSFKINWSCWLSRWSEMRLPI